MEQNLKKYQIDACLQKLSLKDLRDSEQILPKILDISINTLRNYRNITQGDNQDIPYEIVRKFEILLNLRPGELINYNLKGMPLEQAIEEFRKLDSNRDNQMFVHDSFFTKEFLPYPRKTKAIYFVEVDVKIGTITQLTECGIRTIKEVLCMTRSEFLNHDLLTDTTKLDVLNYLHVEHLRFHDDQI